MRIQSIAICGSYQAATWPACRKRLWLVTISFCARIPIRQFLVTWLPFFFFFSRFEPTFASLILSPTLLLQASAVPFLHWDSGLEDDQVHGYSDRNWSVCQLQQFRKMEAYEINANLSKDRTVSSKYAILHEEIAGESLREVSGIASCKSRVPTNLAIIESAWRILHCYFPWSCDATVISKG